MLFILFSLRVWQTISFSLKKKPSVHRATWFLDYIPMILSHNMVYDFKLCWWSGRGYGCGSWLRTSTSRCSTGDVQRQLCVVQDWEVHKYHQGCHVSQWCLRNTVPLFGCFFFFHFLQTVFTKHKMENLILRHMNKEPLLIWQTQCWLLSIKLTCKPRALSYKY